MESLPSKSPAMDIQANEDKVERGEVLLVSASNDDNGLRRDLKRRHINMIAIAGMIVSGRAATNRRPYEVLTASSGHWPIPCIRQCHRNRRPCRRVVRVHRYGPHHMGGGSNDGRDFCLHACDWWLRATCYKVRAAGIGHRCGMGENGKDTGLRQ